MTATNNWQQYQIYPRDLYDDPDDKHLICMTEPNRAPPGRTKKSEMLLVLSPPPVAPLLPTRSVKTRISSFHFSPDASRCACIIHLLVACNSLARVLLSSRRCHAKQSVASRKTKLRSPSTYHAYLALSRPAMAQLCTKSEITESTTRFNTTRCASREYIQVRQDNSGGYVDKS